MRWPSKAAILYVVGVLGSVASILALFGNWSGSKDYHEVYIAISSTVFILALFAIETYLIVQRTRLIRQQDSLQRQRDVALAAATKAEAYRKVFQPLHGIFHKLRDKLFGLQADPPKPDKHYDEAFCTHVLDLTKAIFEYITGGTCSCCIKTFDQEQERVYTLQRDSESEARRGAIDRGRASRLSANTDFDEIMRGLRDWFLENDLVALAKSGLYRNDRQDWQDHYRSTLVLPIRCWDARLDKHQLFGFLCIDSMQTGVFDPHFAVQVGACVADMVFVYFNALDRLRRGSPQERPSEECLGGEKEAKRHGNDRVEEA